MSRDARHDVGFRSKTMPRHFEQNSASHSYQNNVSHSERNKESPAKWNTLTGTFR